MNARNIAWFFVLAAAAGATAYQIPIVSQQRSELSGLWQRQDRLAKDIGRLREPRIQSRGSTTGSAFIEANPVSAEGDSAAAARTLRKFIEDNPALAIPELALLTDRDWLELARRLRPGETRPGDLRLAAEGLRFRAKDIFARSLWQALDGYKRKNPGQLPGEMADLAAFFDRPFDAAILNRYEILRDERATDLAGVPWTLAERSVVDDEYGHRLYLPATGAWRNEEPPNTMNGIIREASLEFAKANRRQPTSPAEIAPFVREDLRKYYDVKTLQHFWPSPRRIDPFAKASPQTSIKITESPEGRTLTEMVEPR